jgi:hypothetical protein
MGSWMPGWMIERTTVVRLGAEAGETPETDCSFGKHSSSLEELEIRSALVAR